MKIKVFTILGLLLGYVSSGCGDLGGLKPNIVTDQLYSLEKGMTKEEIIIKLPDYISIDWDYPKLFSISTSCNLRKP